MSHASIGLSRAEDTARSRPLARTRGLRSGVATHPGRVRERNEDRPYADAERGIFIVVDGIGGHAAGETAAETALALLRRRLERPTGSPEERIREAIAVANNEVVALAQSQPELQGMGCVLTVAVVEDGIVTVGHVGDSRLYRLGRGRMEKLTSDHSPVGEREDRGELGEAEAMAHPRRNEVYRSVGMEQHGPMDSGFIEVVTTPFGPDHALLLCSDGLTDLVTTGQIRQIVSAQAGDPEAVVERLVQAALAAGGKDNVSVVFAEGAGFANGWRAGATLPRREWAQPEPAGSWLDHRGVQFALGTLVGAAIVIALVTLGIGPGARAPGATAVNARGTGALRVGPEQTYRRIEDAMGAARPGDTISVAPGTYREQVRLRPGVTLISATPRAAVLAPGPVGTAAEGAPVVAIVAESVGSGRIAGFTIRGTAGAPIDVGIRLRDAAVAVEDVEITGTRVAAVAIESGTGARVLASWLHDNTGAGVVVRRGAAARIAHNRISDNGLGARAAPGVELEPGAEAEITGNVIVGNGAAGVRGVTTETRGPILTFNQFSSGEQTSRVPVAPAP